MSDPFSPVAITASIAANIATDILKHYGQSLEKTVLGNVMKHAGLIEPNFDDRLRDTLSKALQLYFVTHENYGLSGIVSFFRDPMFGQQIGAHILNREIIDYKKLHQALERHLQGETVTAILVKRKGLDVSRIVPDFLACYRRVLSKQLTVPQIALLLEILDQKELVIAEIQASEARMQAFIADIMATNLSPGNLREAYDSGQKELVDSLVEELDVANLAQPQQAIQTIQQRLASLPALFTDGLCKGRPLHIAADHYFVAHHLDRESLADWRQSLATSLENIDAAQEPLKPYFAGDTLLGGFRLCGISEKLYATRFSIFILPPFQDKNIYLELGIAIGIGAPFFLVQHYEAEIPLVLGSLSRYTKGGLFRTMRRELAGAIEEYDFGVVHFVPEQTPTIEQDAYVIVSGDLGDEDEDFNDSVIDAIKSEHPDLNPSFLYSQIDPSNWFLSQLVERIHTARFTVYRVDEQCSPTTFLALGISIGCNRPFLLTHRAGRKVPRDLDGLRIYQFSSFIGLERELVPFHQAFFNKHVR
jgi:hypothetical protein